MTILDIILLTNAIRTNSPTRYRYIYYFITGTSAQGTQHIAIIGILIDLSEN